MILTLVISGLLLVALHFASLTPNSTFFPLRNAARRISGLMGHTMQEQDTGCSGEPTGAVSERYLELLDKWLGLMAAEL